MSRFRPLDRATDFLLPPSVQEWLPEAHLARYGVDGVEQLDLSALERAYAGGGSAAYPPAMLRSLLIEGDATGTFSSRKIERATYDSLAFRYMACNLHPDHDPLAHCRRRFGAEFQSTFVHGLQVARENQLARFGTVSLDGTQVHANASKHRAWSYGPAETVEARLKADVAELMHQAEAADRSAVPDGVSLPEELQRRQARRAAMAEAKGQIEARARERLAREPAEYEAKIEARPAQPATTGQKPGGKEPPPPPPGPRPDDPINLTDEESRIMPVSGGGFEPCYNAQALVDTDSMRVIATRVTPAPNDKEQLQPMIAAGRARPDGLNPPDGLLADNGFFSEAKVIACQNAGIEPRIALKREHPHPHWRERFGEPGPLASDATPLQTLAHALNTQFGKARYALRKQTVEPGFGIIKSVMGFRQFLLRGLEHVTHEGTLVGLAWNLKRMAVLRP
jgi:transposase